MPAARDHRLDRERAFRLCYLIRRVEEEVARVYPTDAVKSPVHLSIGQEATSVGMALALRPQDVVFGTYRGHALYLAKGGSLQGLVSELYGKVTGCAKGKGGSMHLVEPSVNFMGTSAVVATTIPNAAGYAYAMKYKGEDRVTAVQFGDGAVEEGVFHETMNFSVLHKLPVLFFCENNDFAIHTRRSVRQSFDSIAGLAESYKIPAERILDGDLEKIHAASARAVERIRKGEGPQFIEAVIYRWKEHVGPSDDWHLKYRDASEAEPWKAKDPVKCAGEKIDPAVRKRIEAEVEKELAAAMVQAEKDPYPPAEHLLTDMYA